MAGGRWSTTFPKALCNVALLACALGTLPSGRPAGSVDPQVWLLQFECEQIRVSERLPHCQHWPWSVSETRMWSFTYTPLFCAGRARDGGKEKETSEVVMFAAKCRCTFAHGCDFISRHFRFGIPPSFYRSKVTPMSPLANFRDIPIFSEGKTREKTRETHVLSGSVAWRNVGGDCSYSD